MPKFQQLLKTLKFPTMTYLSPAGNFRVIHIIYKIYQTHQLKHHLHLQPMQAGPIKYQVLPIRFTYFINALNTSNSCHHSLKLIK